METNQQSTQPLQGGQAEDWQDAFLQFCLSTPFAKEWLFILLEEVRDFREATNPTSALCEIAEAYLSNSGINLNKQANRIDLKVLMQHLGYVSRIQEYFDCFDRETGYCGKAGKVSQQKEVSHE